MLSLKDIEELGERLALLERLAPAETNDKSVQAPTSKMTVLDANLVTDDIRRELLSNPTTSKHNDVVLSTADNKLVPANRTLLAIRSTFFNALFFSSFIESTSKIVHVDMRAKTLQDILEFAYTGTSHTIRKGSAFSDGHIVITQLLPSHFTDLIDLAKAADYCDMAPLHDRCNEILKFVAKRDARTTCALLEMKRRQPSTVAFVTMARLHRHVLTDAKHCFLVPHCVEPRRGFAYRARDVDHGFGVLHLSEAALLDLLEAVAGEKEFDNEYGFQIVFYWASQGCVLGEEGNEIVIGSGKGERWTAARAMVTKLKLKKMRARFLEDYVEGTGLADRDTIYDAYRYLATRDAARLELCRQPAKRYKRDGGKRNRKRVWESESSYSDSDSEGWFSASE